MIQKRNAVKITPFNGSKKQRVKAMHISKVTYNPFPFKTLNERRHKIFAHFLFSQKTLYTKTDSQKLCVHGESTSLHIQKH